MDYDHDKKSLSFCTEHEVEQFHSQLSALMRSAMFEASKNVTDAERAKALSKEVFRQYAAVTRALNALRSALPRGRPPRNDDEG